MFYFPLPQAGAGRLYANNHGPSHSLLRSPFPPQRPHRSAPHNAQHTVLPTASNTQRSTHSARPHHPFSLIPYSHQSEHLGFSQPQNCSNAVVPHHSVTHSAQQSTQHTAISTLRPTDSIQHTAFPTSALNTQRPLLQRPTHIVPYSAQHTAFLTTELTHSVPYYSVAFPTSAAD